MTGVTTAVEVATTCFKSGGNCQMKIASPPALIRGDDVFKKMMNILVIQKYYGMI